MRKRRDYKDSDWDIFPWPEPPSGDDDDYGPTEMQENLFIYHKEPWDRPHFHTMDIALMIGGAGSGKSIATIAQIIEVATTYKGCVAVVAGKNMPLLKRNVVDKFGERLCYKSSDGIEYPWEHPVVLKAPAEKTPFATFWNGSSIRFLNIDDPTIVRGFTADIFAIEEVNLMNAASLKEMFRRSRGNALPVRQFILNMNPTGAQDWVYNMFNLKQLRNDYNGPVEPIGSPCSCEFCHVCLGAELGNYTWVGGEKKVAPSNGAFYEWVGGECPNPQCPTLLNNIKRGKGPVKQKKTNTCPGAQHYYRVIKSASLDNPHLPSDFAQLQRGALSKEEYETYVKGEIVDLNTGYIYKDFSDENVKEVEFDPYKDIFWTMDFNFDPMCSQICQESNEGINVVDEFTLWNADEMTVAKEFVKRYRGYTGKVWLYGDPNGILVTSRADSSKTSFKVILDYLKLHGFNVEIGVKKIKGDTLIPIISRVNTLKAAIKSVEGISRIFINSKCVNLLESVKHTKWKENSTSPKEDDSCDAVAKQNPKRTEEAVLMTHPQAALGYLVFRRKPLLFSKRGVQAMVTTEGTIIATDKASTGPVRPKFVPTPPPDENKPRSLMDFLGWGGGRINKSLQERLDYEKWEREQENEKDI